MLYLGIPKFTVKDNVVTAFDAADVMRLTYHFAALPAEECDVIRQNYWLLGNKHVLLEVAILETFTLDVFNLNNVQNRWSRVIFDCCYRNL